MAPAEDAQQLAAASETRQLAAPAASSDPRQLLAATAATAAATASAWAASSAPVPPAAERLVAADALQAAVDALRSGVAREHGDLFEQCFCIGAVQEVIFSFCTMPEIFKLCEILRGVRLWIKGWMLLSPRVRAP